MACSRPAIGGITGREPGAMRMCFALYRLPFSSTVCGSTTVARPRRMSTPATAGTAAYGEEIVIEAYFRFFRFSSTSSSSVVMRLCCGLSASHLRAFLTRCSICALGMPSTPWNIEASSFSLADCAALRTSASLPSIAPRSRLVTIRTVLSSAMLLRLPCALMLSSSPGFYQRIALARRADRPFGRQLVEVRRERAGRDSMHAHRNIVVDERQQLLHRRRTNLYERADHLCLARAAVRDQARELLLRRA